MLSFSDGASIAGALTMPLEPRLRELLMKRLPEPSLAELTHFLVIEPGDTEEGIRDQIGFSPLVSPYDQARYGSPGFVPFWDWLQAHGGWFELIVAVGNSGFAYILFIQDAEGVLPDLLSLCRTYAE